ncbi:MAG: lipoate-protein ligase A [halophilic archaeon J07HX64]|jgi:Lipoate-protein ligase A|nr:MAG: lipoate-protein ligase A [halophilic archaeon J07HX64]
MSNLADRGWRLIREESRPGPTQMALDEVAAETAAQGGPRTVRVYRWEPSTLSLGYRQPPETVDWGFCADHSIDVTRRPTGGGGIYHDAVGDISYTIAAPADEVPGELLACYELLCEPVLSAFERMGVDAAFADEERSAIHQPACYLRAIDPAHDILAGGRKISGNAQYRQRDAVVQHGSLSYAPRVERHLGVFDTDLDADRFRDRVTSVREQTGIERETAVAALEGALGEWADASEGEWTDAELERAADLVDQKYGTDRWVREREEPV